MSTRSLLLLLPLAACDGPGPDRRGRGEATDDGGVTVGSVNGQPADVYYDQFTWEAVGSYLAGAAAFPTAPDGRNALLTHLYLLGDGRFVLFYEEGEGDVSVYGWSLSTYVDSQMRREGRWSVRGATLDVGGVLSCTGMQMNGDEQLSCRLEEALLTEEAVGSGVRLSPDVFGPTSPDDSTWVDYR